MRVLHVLHTSLPEIIGYTVRSDYLLTLQQCDGIQPIVVTSARHPAPAAATEFIKGIPHHRLPHYGDGVPPLYREWQLMRRLEKRVAEIVRAYRPHLIHAHSPSLCGFPALRVAQRFGVPFVYEIRDLWENASVDRGKFGAGSLFYRCAAHLENYILRRAHGLTPICEALRAEVVARRGQTDHVLVCPNGVDLEHYHPQPPDPTARARWNPEGGPLIAYVGALQPYEGIPVLIRAFARVVRELPTARLLIAGGGSELPALQRLIRELGLGGRALVPGPVPRDQVRGMLSIADLLVYPRLRTRTTCLTTPLKPLEAMAAGKAVIASDLPALRELVRPGETGELFPAEDEAALAAGCVALLRDPDRRQQLGQRARAYVERERNWAAIVRRYAPLYRELLARYPLRPGYCVDVQPQQPTASPLESTAAIT